MRQKLEFLCWLLPPSALKNAILRRFGHQIADSASIGPVFVTGVRRFEIEENVRIWPFAVFTGLRLVRLRSFSVVKSWVWLSAAPEFQDYDPQAGTLELGFGSGIGARSSLDCSGTIIIEKHSNVGGHRAFLQTTAWDLDLGRLTAGRIVVGHHSLVASCGVLLKGAHLPAQSVLAANSTMLAPTTDDQKRGVYAGSPAEWKIPTHGKWFEHTEHVIRDHVVDGQMGLRTRSAMAPGVEVARTSHESEVSDGDRSAPI